MESCFVIKLELNHLVLNLVSVSFITRFVQGFFFTQTMECVTEP